MHAAGIYCYSAEAASQGKRLVGWGHDENPVRARAKAKGEALERLAFALAPRTLAERCRPWSEVEKAQVHKVWRGYRWFSHEQLSTWPECRALERPGDVAWIRALDWTSGAPTWVPEFCLSNPKAPFYVHDSSNGWAAAPTAAAARARAVAELLERDAFLEHWWSARAPVRWRLEGLPKLPSACSRELERREMSYCALHFPTKWPIHVAGTVLRRRRPHFFVLGLGADLDPATALRKSFLEALAFLLHHDHPRTNPLDLAQLDPERGLFKSEDRHYYYGMDPRNSAPTRLLTSARPRRWDAPASATAAELKAALRAAGQAIFVVDMPTPLGRGIHVAKAFAPGLVGLDFRHRHRNWGAPALRGLPLNPHPHPLC